MLNDHVFKAKDGWLCIVNGKVYGVWSCKEYAEAGMQVEQRRAASRQSKQPNSQDEIDD